MNPRTRRAALYAIGAIAILASANALAHSYAGLYDWAVHHRLAGWQAMSWPAEIDVFLAVGELALYVAYLDGWPARQRIWPWATALIGPGGQRRREHRPHRAAARPPGHPGRPADRSRQPGRRVRRPDHRTAGLEDDLPAARHPPAVANAAAEPATHGADGGTLSRLAADSATTGCWLVSARRARIAVRPGGLRRRPAGRQPAEPESDGESLSAPRTRVQAPQSARRSCVTRA